MNKTYDRWTKAEAARIREAGARWARGYCRRADRNGSGLPACKGCKWSVGEFQDCHGNLTGWREMEVSRMRMAMAEMVRKDRQR